VTKINRLLLGLLVATLWTLTVSSQFPVAQAAPLPTLSLLNQTFNVSSESQLRFIFDDDSKFLSNTVEIELHRRVASRRSFQSIANGDAQSGVLDALTLTSTQIKRINNTVQVTAPLAQRVDSPQALFIALDGVYPISIRIRDAVTHQAVAELLTFINVRRTGRTNKHARSSQSISIVTTRRKSVIN
jgi:hypothetical protein